MDITSKEELSGLSDMGKDAAARRLVAARRHVGLTQTQLAENCGLQTNALNNMEKARQFPNRAVMKYLYRAHGIDFNFLMFGSFSQFPQSVQDSLFQKLADEKNKQGP